MLGRRQSSFDYRHLNLIISLNAIYGRYATFASILNTLYISILLFLYGFVLCIKFSVFFRIRMSVILIYLHLTLKKWNNDFEWA
jgi:hypothetical protein